MIVQISVHGLRRSCVEQFATVLVNHPGYCEVKLAVVEDNRDVTLMTLGGRLRVRWEPGFLPTSKSCSVPMRACEICIQSMQREA